MVTIVTRAGKASELTHDEVDANFTNLAAATGVEDHISSQYVVGQYYSNQVNGLGTVTNTGVANRVMMGLFYTSRDLRIDELGISVSTAVASSSLKCFVYDSDANGWPDGLIYEGSSDLSGATTGYKFHTVDITFTAGQKYWLGVKMNSTASYRSVSAAACPNLGTNTSNGSGMNIALLRSLTYANALPDPWVFTTADLSTISPPSIRMRAAAL